MRMAAEDDVAARDSRIFFRGKTAPRLSVVATIRL